VAGQRMERQPRTWENMRIKLTLAYDGSEYKGWQLQKNDPTIQGFVEDAIGKICGFRVPVHGSGRTDSGVHALGQTAHFDPPGDKVSLPWQRALNSILPDSIRVVRSQTVSPDFHARFSAVSKTYSYTLWTESDFIFPQRKNFVWQTGRLNLEAMKKASDFILGTRDFRAFMNSGTTVENTIRQVRTISFDSGFYPQELVIRVSADGFLKQMVRNIIGALVVIGRKKYPPDHLRQVLFSGHRILAPATAPARGLCLECVRYPGE
jgi:tRNA pseudouridine38-40 synthase